MSAKPRHGHRHALPAQAVRERHALYSSGASGVHTDQQARRNGAVGATNRVTTRRERRQAAIADQER